MADGAGAVLLRRARIRVTGLVQGVGFRPHVYRLAREENLSGFVQNDPNGVLIEAEGVRLGTFLGRLQREAPPLARIDAVRVEAALSAQGGTDFVIRESASAGAILSDIAPDAAPCRDCLEELFDPAGRRWRHAFISCTNCGPRFTITARLPYDRPQTSMAAFPLCAACDDEYRDPGDRRFHAEPIACPACGPKLSLRPLTAGSFETAGDPIARTLAAIESGKIVALKGVGGFQLVCDARNEDAVARLRAAKERGGKPFAVMVASVASARALCALSETESEVLAGADRPIVLCRRGASDGLAPSVAPGMALLGLMLPASPLHMLLFHEAAGRPAGTGWLAAAQTLALVATSANRGGRPLLTDGQAAEAALAGIADLILDHDRAILIRADDPVVRVIAGRARSLRRGRGQTPAPLPLQAEGPPVLALGGHLKAAVCVTRAGSAYLSQHVGDLDDAETIGFLRETAHHLCAILDVRPRAIACDWHPDFASTALAHALGDVFDAPVAPVQHHHAHALGCLAEHGHQGPALALVLDGYGYGEAGAAWGGELLRVDGAVFQRLGGLGPLPLPGGEKAAREPWRMAAGALAAMGRVEEIAARFPAEAQAAGLARLLAAGPSAQTSACGRLFDAAAGLLGLCSRQGFEAQAAMMLEALASRAPATALAPLDPAQDLTLDPLALLAPLDRARDAAGAARAFHDRLADHLAALVVTASGQTGLAIVALSGGCLANALLAERLIARLTQAGLTPLLPALAPAGDGGLALGQAIAARYTLEGS